jgi:hypothetical protein
VTSFVYVDVVLCEVLCVGECDMGVFCVSFWFFVCGLSVWFVEYFVVLCRWKCV